MTTTKIWGQTQSHAQVTLTAYQRKAIYKTLYFMIEELEQCIDKCYPNWHNKKQIRDDNRPLIDSLEEATESFSVALFGFNKVLTNRPSHLLPELQNEFYRCFAQETFNRADANFNRMSKEECAKALGQAFGSVQVPLENGRKEEEDLVGKNYNDITIKSRFGGTTEHDKTNF
nr:9913_t:CDS:2 [Entrophospora candida]